MKKVAIHLAKGFETVEALTQVDLLKRAGINIITVSVTQEKVVESAQGVKVTVDKLLNEVNYDEIDMIILPGGMPGTTNLENSDDLKRIIIDFDIDNKYIAAICAAPMILGKMGFLEEKNATCYPGFEKYLLNANYLPNEKVVVADNIITSRGVGTAIDFGLKLIEILIDKEKSDEVAKSILVK
ncbi:MAG: protein deglycase [Fusobacteriaceae bacterium]|jgi:4-methyl-5(b-hydroxyethyl)-thiazole monophosphate biosynthesis|nr:protein deglycase [Fusobacteriaceae bacterium]